MKHSIAVIFSMLIILTPLSYASSTYYTQNIALVSTASENTPPPSEKEFFSTLQSENNTTENTPEKKKEKNDINNKDATKTSKHVTVSAALSYLNLTNHLLTSYNFYNENIRLFDVDKSQLNSNINLQASFNPNKNIFIDANGFVELTHLDSAFSNSNLNSTPKYDPRYILGIKSLYADIIHGNTDIIIGKKLFPNGFTQDFSNITDLYNSEMYANFIPTDLGSWQVALQYHFKKSNILFAILPLGTQVDTSPYFFSWGSNSLNFIPVIEQLVPSTNSIFHISKYDGNPSDWDYLMQYIFSGSHNNFFSKIYYGNEKYYTLHQISINNYKIFKPDVIQASAGYEWHNNILSIFSEALFSKTINNYDDNYISGLIGFKAHNTSLANKIHMQSLEPEMYISGEYIYNHPQNELFQQYINDFLTDQILNVSSYWLRNNNQAFDTNLTATFNSKWYSFAEIKYYYNNKATKYNIALLYKKNDHLRFATYYAYFKSKELTTPLYLIRDNGIIGINAEISF